MALYLATKSPSEVIRYAWLPAIVGGDSVNSATLAVASGTAVIDSYEVDGDTVYAFVSGGTAGETTSITATALTADGETILDTIYVPIRAETNLYTNTARDVCNFAFRKIAGVGVDMDSAELDVALECLNDMLALWRIDGPDIGIAKELVAGDTLTVPESYLTAVKYNLAVLLAEEFDRPLTATLDRVARESKQAVATALLGMGDLSFERTLTRPKPMTSINDI